MNLAHLELYARYVWPLQRRFVARAARCRKCVLSEHYGLLVAGVCEACDLAEGGSADEQPRDVELFDATIATYIDTGRRERDAIVLLSGGKDSAYVLNLMRDRYPRLRLLAVTVNNGFMAPLALRNAARCAERLGVDHLVLHAHVDQFSRGFRAAFSSLTRGASCYEAVDGVDGTLVYKFGRRLAQALGAPLVIGGMSWVQLKRICGVDGFESSGDGPTRTLHPLAVWRTAEATIRWHVRDAELLEADSPLLTNNRLLPAMCAVDFERLGYCGFEPEFAQLVREGKADRTTWLHLFELAEYLTRTGPLREQADAILAELNLTWERVTCYA